MSNQHTPSYRAKFNVRYQHQHIYTYLCDSARQHSNMTSPLPDHPLEFGDVNSPRFPADIPVLKPRHSHHETMSAANSYLGHAYCRQTREWHQFFAIHKHIVLTRPCPTSTFPDKHHPPVTAVLLLVSSLFGASPIMSTMRFACSASASRPLVVCFEGDAYIARSTISPDNTRLDVLY
jgi:hypothetical protein